MLTKLSLMAAGLTVALVSGVADATELSVTYNYTAKAAVYPNDDPATGDQYTTTGSVHQLVNVDAEYFQINTPASKLLDFPGAIQELTAMSKDGEFSFSVYVNLPSDFSTYGTYNINAGTDSVVEPNLGDTFSFGNGGINVPGGFNSGDGYRQDATFSVTGSITLAEVSAVPLPASAPMFGAALLALGAVGYGARHKRPVAAV